MKTDDAPKFMGPRIDTMTVSAKQHKYNMPDSGKDIIEAIQWMMSAYDDVESSYGEDYGCPYCYLVGTVR